MWGLGFGLGEVPFRVQGFVGPRDLVGTKSIRV